MAVGNHEDQLLVSQSTADTAAWGRPAAADVLEGTFS